MTITVAVVFIVSAFVCYTVAIWSERFVGKLRSWMIWVFEAGFACDLIGTSAMFLRATNRFSLNTHTFFGYLALIIMLLHLIWAILAASKGGRYQEYFTRFSRLAWFVWLIAFVSCTPRAPI